MAPRGLAPELPNGACDDRTAPKDGVGLVLEQQVGAHDLDAVLGDFGQHKVAKGMDVASAHTEHLGDGGTGDVGIEDADLVAVTGKLGGDGTGDKRLADTALAGKHGDDAFDLGQRVLLKLRRRRLSAGGLCVLATHV